MGLLIDIFYRQLQIYCAKQGSLIKKTKKPQRYFITMSDLNVVRYYIGIPNSLYLPLFLAFPAYLKSIFTRLKVSFICVANRLNRADLIDKEALANAPPYLPARPTRQKRGSDGAKISFPAFA